MFRLHRPPPAPYDIYSSSLETLYLGHALWYPEPHVTGEPQIGDVGFIRRGAFIRLFNLDTSVPEKKVTFKWREPSQALEPLPPDMLQVDSRSGPLVPKRYCSHGVEAKEIHFSADAAAGTGAPATVSVEYVCKAGQGAVLELQSEAYEETLFENHNLKTFIIQNYDQWYRYAKDDLGQDIKEEDIVFVSGWIKTTADWAITTFSSTSSKFGASLKARLGGFAGLEAGGSHTRTVTGPEMERRGKDYSEKMSKGERKGAKKVSKGARKEAKKASEMTTAGAKKDQCTFLRRCRVRKRLGLPQKVIAGASYHQLPDPGDARDGLRGEGVMAQEAGDMDEGSMIELKGGGEITDPLDVLLDYILEASQAEVAIADDDDVRGLVGGKQVVDFASYLRQVQPPVHVDGTIGSLCMEDVISSEQARAIARRTITKVDLAKWPNIATDGVGRLEDGHVFIGPTKSEARSLKMKKQKHLAFADSRNPSNDCLCFALSTDGRLLAASFRTHDVLVWRLPDGLLVQRLHHQAHTSFINSLSFSPNNRAVVSGSGDKNVIVWDVRSGHVLLRLGGHYGVVESVAYAPHGALLATASLSRKSVKIWDALTGACLQSFDTGGHGIYQLAFSPEGSRLCAELTSSVLIHDIQTNTRIATIPRATWSKSHQGDRIVTVPNGGVKIWSAATGGEVLTVNHSKRLSSPVEFSPDGAEVLAACNADKTVVTFDLQTGQLRRVFALSGGARCAAYSPNGECLVLGNASKELKVFNAKSGVLLATLEVNEDIRDAQFVSDSQNLLVKVADRPLILYNIQDMVRLR